MTFTNSPRAFTVTREQVAEIMSDLFTSCQVTRDAGQKEYAHSEDNALSNFERTAERTGVTREQAWAVFAGKHWDGIMAHVKGHHSQREHVEGRIKDLVVYLVLYLAMVKQDEGTIRAMNQYKIKSAMDAAPTKATNDPRNQAKEIGDPNDR